MYVRVRDPETRHEFDVPEDSPLLRRELVIPVKSKRYPPSRIQRPAKHHIRLAGRTASRETAAAPVVAESQDAPAPATEATEKE
jgi:hypothetical protein